jgi:hypothetical protein
MVTSDRNEIGDKIDIISIPSYIALTAVVAIPLG